MAYKIVHEREKCIGCGACVSACPYFWTMGADKKSTLKGAEGKEGIFILEVEEAGCNKAAEASCPVGIIHVEEAV